MTQRLEKEEFRYGVSILEHITAGQSFIGAAMHNGMSVNHGFTPRLTFNCTSVTLSQLAEVVATILANDHRKAMRVVGAASDS